MSVRVHADEVMDAVSWDQYNRFRRGAIWLNPFKLEAVYDADEEEGLMFRVRGETGSYNVRFRLFDDGGSAVSCSCPDPFAGLCKHACWVVFKVLKHDDLAVFRTGTVPMELVWHVIHNEDAQAHLAETWGRNIDPSFRLPDRRPSFAAWFPDKKACPFLQTEPWPPVNTECAVCFEDMEHEQAKQCPGCSNSFHGVCIAKWFSQKRSCPLCRKTFF